MNYSCEVCREGILSHIGADIEDDSVPGGDNIIQQLTPSFHETIMIPKAIEKWNKLNMHLKNNT